MPRPLRRRPPQPSPLTYADVYRIVAEFAPDKPLTTVDIAEFCRSRFPDMPGITTQRVSQLLHWLSERDRVATWAGAERETLEGLGVVEPQQRMRYWALRRSAQ